MGTVRDQNADLEKSDDSTVVGLSESDSNTQNANVLGLDATTDATQNESENIESTNNLQILDFPQEGGSHNNGISSNAFTNVMNEDDLFRNVDIQSTTFYDVDDSTTVLPFNNNGILTGVTLEEKIPQSGDGSIGVIDMTNLNLNLNFQNELIAPEQDYSTEGSLVIEGSNVNGIQSQSEITVQDVFSAPPEIINTQGFADQDGSQFSTSSGIQSNENEYSDQSQGVFDGVNDSQDSPLPSESQQRITLNGLYQTPS